MKSTPKQPSCKKEYDPQNGYGEKRCEIQVGSQETAVMDQGSKNFDNDNSGEFCAKTKRYENSPELLLLKFLPLTYHHSHFLATTLDHTFFHHSIFEDHTLF